MEMVGVIFRYNKLLNEHIGESITFILWLYYFAIWSADALNSMFVDEIDLYESSILVFG